MKIILWFSTLLQVLFCTLADFCFHLLGSFLILCADRDIGLELRLSPGRTHHDGAVAFQQELKHIGFRQTIQPLRIIQQLDDLLASKCLDIAAESLHDALHLGKASAALKLVAVKHIHAVAIPCETANELTFFSFHIQVTANAQRNIPAVGVIDKIVEWNQNTVLPN